MAEWLHVCTLFILNKQFGLQLGFNQFTSSFDLNQRGASSRFENRKKYNLKGKFARRNLMETAC